MKKRLILFAAFCAVLSPALPSSEFSNIDRELEELETLITDTLKNTEEQQKLLEDLQASLSLSGTLIDSYGNIIAGQEKSLAELQERLNKMSETYRTQSALLRKSERRSRFWKIFTIVAVPTAAAVSGVAVWAVCR